MFRIASIEIVGFRGSQKPLTIPMDADVNFIIGRNGTGKTTLMNLLNSALSGDVQNLLRTDFVSIQFKLQQPRDKSRPFIRVVKSQDEDGDAQISYFIAESARSKPKQFSFDLTDIRGNFLRKSARTWNTRHLFVEDLSADQVKAAIHQLIRTSWISVHRALLNTSDDGERKFASPVDRKLYQVARDFGVYFSVLDKIAAEETDKFQQVYLLALISPSGFDGLSDLSSVNPDEEKSAIRGMFAEFAIKSSVYNQKLEAFTKRMSKALANFSPSKALPADDFLVLTDTIRIHDAVKEWHSLLEKRAQIYRPKNDFISIINELFFRKKVSINQGNQPVFHNDAGVEIDIDTLSSGEKQLFILLGETLLQRRRPCIFMADEPELSLHIDWQERLVPSLRRINPNAQIIFATHSPDIVGAFGSNTIDLEKIA